MTANDRETTTHSSLDTVARSALLLLVALIGCAGRADTVDQALLAYIGTVRAIDGHAHPMRVVATGAPADSEYDALPLDGLPPFPMPARLRLDDPQWRAAQRALYGVSLADTGDVYRTGLADAKAKIMLQQGDRFPEWALDQSNIDVMLANRIVLGAGLAPPRFRWVSFADPLMLPLDTRDEAARTPDTKSLYPKETKLLQRYLRELSVGRLPASLDGYVNQVVRATLERQKQGGAVAVKFEAAYLRALDFDDADSAGAATIYARYAGRGVPTVAEYKTLQDYLFRVICREAGRLGLAVQIHVLEGFGGFYSSRGSSPHLLESTVNDSTLRATNFVIVHGGWPRTDETLTLLARPNVYADISAMVLYVEPTQIGQVLRQWLAQWPERVLFGSDAFEGGPEQGWADVAYVGTRTARAALTSALSGMMHDGEIDRARAELLARMVFRDNAEAAYQLKVVR